DDSQLARRSRRRVDPSELAALDREHPERVRVAEVVLARERELLQVVDRGDVLRLGADEALAVERDSRLHVRDERPEPVGLEGLQSFARECLGRGLEDHRATVEVLRSGLKNGSSTTVAAVRLRLASTVHSTSIFVPSSLWSASTDASASTFFSV